MNAAQLARFDGFLDDHYPEILAEVTERDLSGAVRRTRSGFASAYRFWSKSKPTAIRSAGSTE